MFRQLNVIVSCIVAAGLAGAVAGCQDEPLEYTEVRRIDEQITNSELLDYVSVINGLANEEPPEFPQVYSPTADWLHTRQLPVADLVDDEIKQIRQCWDVDYLAQKLEKNKILMRHLKDARMTPQQFAGLTLALGAAYGRAVLRDDQDLKTIIDNGHREVEQLMKVSTPFANLREDEKYARLKQAAWITRQHRAEQLRLVPEENIELVLRHEKILKKTLPPQFVMNPLDDVADLLLEKGLPFDVIEGSPSEGPIIWDVADAIVGYDVPDDQLAAEDQKKPNPPTEVEVESLPQPPPDKQNPSAAIDVPMPARR